MKELLRDSWSTEPQDEGEETTTPTPTPAPALEPRRNPPRIGKPPTTQHIPTTSQSKTDPPARGGGAKREPVSDDDASTNAVHTQEHADKVAADSSEPKSLQDATK